ncbi:asparagine synthase-related protein [Bacteroidota bacterium]
MISLKLIYKAGFSWHSNGDCHVKGFVHTENRGYLSGDALLEYFNSCSDFEEFKNRVGIANGMFSVVLIRKGNAWLAVDRMRTFPLFYANIDSNAAGPGKTEEKGTLISDSVDQIIDYMGGWTLNQDASTEFLASGYVTGTETLAEGISQVQAAEVVEILASDIAGDAGLEFKRNFYSSYRTAQPFDGPVVKLEEELDGIIQKVFRRLLDSIQGRTAVIALSGGYDSRLIVAMLKKLEFPNVICFSYGRRGNPDMLRAEEVALKLGYEFIPIEHTDEMISGFLGDNRFYDYVRFSSNMVSMFFMQEYFAIRYLKDNELVPGDSVFIPGHSGDFFAGSQLIRHGLHNRKEKDGKTIKRLFEVKYELCKPGSFDNKTMLDRIKQSLHEKDSVEDALPYSIHEDWDLKEKLAKFIVNSCNIYAWYGYEYRLPLYDYELQDFFRDVPFELKANKRLYDNILRKRIFSDLDLNFPSELQPDEKTQQKARLKGKIKKILPGSLIPTTVSREDPIFYHEITRALQQDLGSKGITIKIRGNNYNSLIVQWYIEFLKAESDRN